MRFFSLFLILFCPQIYGMTAEQFLVETQKKNQSFRSIEQLEQAARIRYGASDLELSPVLTVSGRYIDDKVQNAVTPTYIIDRTKAREYNLGLSKKFGFSGTSASVQATSSDASMDLLTPGTPPGFTSTSGAKGSLALIVSQSLWKDSFGYGTRQRQDRDENLTKLENASVKLQKNQLLAELESLYWDYLYQQKDLEIKKSSLERARKLEKWMSSRVTNGLGERADLLGTQSLAAGRELQVQMAEDELTHLKKQMANALEVSEQELPKIDDSIAEAKSFSELKNSDNMVRYDALLSQIEYQAKKSSANYAKDSVRPDLSLEGMYKTNNTDSSIDKVSQKIGDQDRPTSAIGIKLTWLLDGSAKDSVAETAKLDALSAQYKKDRKILEGKTAWKELVRRHQELSEKINTAQRIFEIQTKRAQAERERFQKGRSITSSVISAEGDAQESELTLNKLKIERRKIEAQARLFTTLE